MQARRDDRDRPLDPWLLGIVRDPSIRAAKPTRRFGRAPTGHVGSDDDAGPPIQVTAEGHSDAELWLWAGKRPAEPTPGEGRLRPA